MAAELISGSTRNICVHLDYSGAGRIHLVLASWLEGLGRRAAMAVWVCAGMSWAGAQTATPPVPPGPPAKPQGEIVMTPRQAKELFESVDQIMSFAANDTGLPPVVKVKRRLVTREEVNKYLVKSFEDDESAKRLQRSEIVLKKFGLLNRDFDLKPFLLSLLTEQIAGYYDEKTKTVNLLNWIEPEEQKPVLAHELTHALQDQRVNLEKWSDSGFKGTSKTASEDAERVAVDEKETARQAVAEGQAMVVFVDYGLPKGETLAEHPELGQKMKEAAADSSGSPIMSRAPLLLQRTLVFPYADGLSFEQALLAKGGKELAFAGALANPPNSSFEVMNPEAYLAHVAVPVLRLGDVHGLLDAQYEPYDVGVMGELDVEIMASLFGGPQMAAALSPQWDGGVYYAGQRKSATAAEKATTASIGVMYYSRWKSAEAAQAFAKLYAAELGRKYSQLMERKAEESGAGEQVYSTNEGDVLVSLDGPGLFVAEGFSLATARKLRDEVLSVQGSGPMRMAKVPGRELTLGTLVWSLGFGVIQPATVGRYTSLR